MSKRRYRCLKCNGTGYYGGRYGLVACDYCNKGFMSKERLDEFKKLEERKSEFLKIKGRE